MNRTGLTWVIPLIVLTTIMVTTPIVAIENAFAVNGHGHGRHTGGSLNQAASISNSCLNPVSNSNTNDNMISNGNCGGTISQQGGSGQASTPTTVQNANPTIEVQRSTTTQPSMTPNPDSRATLNVFFSCFENGGICGADIVANITITGNNPQPSTFFIGDTEGSQAVTLGAGNYTVTLTPIPNGPEVAFHGDCKNSLASPFTANGTIAAGQTQNCMILQVE